MQAFLTGPTSSVAMAASMHRAAFTRQSLVGNSRARISSLRAYSVCGRPLLGIGSVTIELRP
jgi:hypothetical protein